MSLEPKQNVGITASLFEDVRLDDAAFEVLFKEHFISLCTYCEYRYGFCLEVAKEVVHVAFIRLWENRNAVTPGLSVKAYLYKIVSNISIDMLKHEKVKQRHEKYVIQNTALNGYTQDYENVDYKKLENDVDRAVLDLPEQMQVVFKLSRYEGLKYLEIAKRLGISVKTVETQMSRALLKLRQKLAPYLTIFIMCCMAGS